MPAMCPTEWCDDPFPLSPRKDLIQLQTRYMNEPSRFLALEICQLIKVYKKMPSLRNLGKANRWPHDIDFETLPDRIIGMTEEIRKVLKNEIILSCSPCWKAFICALQGHDIKFIEFSQLNAKQKFQTVGKIAHVG